MPPALIVFHPDYMDKPRLEVWDQNVECFKCIAEEYIHQKGSYVLGDSPNNGGLCRMHIYKSYPQVSEVTED